MLLDALLSYLHIVLVFSLIVFQAAQTAVLRPAWFNAATLARAASFIEKMEKGYDEVISESGGNLSGGQKQRISIARALCTQAPIIVLDEPTSALDPQHEAMITATLSVMKRERTIILVSHRLSTVADADRIYVMQEGKVTEQGTHDQLIALRGHYYEMAKHQMRLE